MKMPDKINTYCPFCRKVTKHKVKLQRKGRTRGMSAGQKRHDRKTKGYTSKVAGKITVYKQSKKPTLMLTCTECGKKHPRSLKSRTKKKIEFEKR